MPPGSRPGVGRSAGSDSERSRLSVRPCRKAPLCCRSTKAAADDSNRGRGCLPPILPLTYKNGFTLFINTGVICHRRPRQVMRQLQGALGMALEGNRKCRARGMPVRGPLMAQQPESAVQSEANAVGALPATCWRLCWRRPAWRPVPQGFLPESFSRMSVWNILRLPASPCEHHSGISTGPCGPPRETLEAFLWLRLDLPGKAATALGQRPWSVGRVRGACCFPHPPQRLETELKHGGCVRGSGPRPTAFSAQEQLRVHAGSLQIASPEAGRQHHDLPEQRPVLPRHPEGSEQRGDPPPHQQSAGESPLPGLGRVQISIAHTHTPVAFR